MTRRVLTAVTVWHKISYLLALSLFHECGDPQVRRTAAGNGGCIVVILLKNVDTVGLDSLIGETSPSYSVSWCIFPFLFHRMTFMWVTMEIEGVGNAIGGPFLDTTIGGSQNWDILVAFSLPWPWPRDWLIFLPSFLPTMSLLLRRWIRPPTTVRQRLSRQHGWNWPYPPSLNSHPSSISILDSSIERTVFEVVLERKLEGYSCGGFEWDSHYHRFRCPGAYDHQWVLFFFSDPIALRITVSQPVFDMPQFVNNLGFFTNYIY